MAHLYNTPDEWLGFYQLLAEELGGICLSNEYVNNKTKLHWRCAEGHEWEALPQNIKRGHWCQVCGNKRQGRQKAKNIETAHKLAQARGGECLSSEYTNNRTRLTWRCSEGHEWEAIPASIQRGSWCPKCAGKLPPVDAIRELRELAKTRSGECLSEQYLDAKTKLRWRCAEGHEWKAIPDSVRRGTWCPHCAGSIRLTLSAMQETARSMGGECLSSHYSNSDEKLLWRCASGHTWWAVAYHVRAGHWCPVCMAGNSERICKDIFEQIFGKAFPKVKPAWLVNTRGKKMELDGYCEELKLAFEYHGIQHYQHIEHFHRGNKTLEMRKRDDARKARLCHEHGVQLIVIPHTIPLSEVPEYIHRTMQERGLPAPMKLAEQVKVAEFVLPEKNQAMQLLAEQRGGLCLSSVYVNNSTKLRWRCADGHEWEAVSGSIQQGSWCPFCAGRLPRDKAIQMLQEIASTRGGRCLSKSYADGKKKLRWQCALGHEWEAATNNIRQGSWCPECAKKVRGPKRLGIEVCRQAAYAKGGECLSAEYVNTDTKLRWRCAEGHEWEAIPDSVVRRGTWCPKCGGIHAWGTRRQKIYKI